MLQAVSTNDGWMSAIRSRGMSDAARLPLPNRKLEAWRYTPTGFLEQTPYRALTGVSFEALQLTDIDEFLLSPESGPRLVFVNGYLAPKLCDLASVHEGVSLVSLSGALGPVRQTLRRRLTELSLEHDSVFEAMNSALMTDGALVCIAGDSGDNAPIEILHISVSGGEPGISHPRHLVVLEEGARAEVVERYCSLGGGGDLINARIDIALSPDSVLRHQRLFEEHVGFRHYSDLRVRLDSNSRYEMDLAALGTTWSRSDIRVVFDGEGAESELNGLMLAGEGQVNDVHLHVRHDVPHCTSKQTFKSILQGKSKVVFDGHIHVAKDAQKTDAQLANDNLMLSRSAEVDSKPQLEICADDVKCSHGTTVGELDGEMLFYLRSRGVPADRAVQMLCQGFAQSIIDRVPNELLRLRSGRLLEQRLANGLLDFAKPADRS